MIPAVRLDAGISGPVIPAVRLDAGIAGRTDGTPAVALAWLGRVSTFVFFIDYTALDSIGGFGLGRAILNTQALEADGSLTADQLQGVSPRRSLGSRPLTPAATAPTAPRG